MTKNTSRGGRNPFDEIQPEENPFDKVQPLDQAGSNPFDEVQPADGSKDVKPKDDRGMVRRAIDAVKGAGQEFVEHPGDAALAGGTAFGEGYGAFKAGHLASQALNPVNKVLAAGIQKGASYLPGPFKALGLIPAGAYEAGLGMLEFAGTSALAHSGIKKLEDLSGTKEAIEQAQQANPNMASVGGAAAMGGVAKDSVTNYLKSGVKRAAQSVAGAAGAGAAFPYLDYAARKGVNAVAGEGTVEDPHLPTSEEIKHSIKENILLGGMGRPAEEPGGKSKPVENEGKTKAPAPETDLPATPEEQAQIDKILRGEKLAADAADAAAESGAPETAQALAESKPKPKPRKPKTKANKETADLMEEKLGILNSENPDMGRVEQINAELEGKKPAKPVEQQPVVPQAEQPVIEAPKVDHAAAIEAINKLPMDRGGIPQVWITEPVEGVDPQYNIHRVRNQITGEAYGRVDKESGERMARDNNAALALHPERYADYKMENGDMFGTDRGYYIETAQRFKRKSGLPEDYEHIVAGDSQPPVFKSVEQQPAPVEQPVQQPAAEAPKISPEAQEVAEEVGVDATKVVPDANGEVTKEAVLEAAKQEADQQLPPEEQGTRIRVSPAARKMAEEIGLDLAQVQPGESGIITKGDIQRLLSQSAEAPLPEEAAKEVFVKNPQVDRVAGSQDDGGQPVNVYTKDTAKAAYDFTPTATAEEPTAVGDAVSRLSDRAHFESKSLFERMHAPYNPKDPDYLGGLLVGKQKAEMSDGLSLAGDGAVTTTMTRYSGDVDYDWLKTMATVKAASTGKDGVIFKRQFGGKQKLYQIETGSQDFEAISGQFKEFGFGDVVLDVSPKTGTIRASVLELDPAKARETLDRLKQLATKNNYEEIHSNTGRGERVQADPETSRTNVEQALERLSGQGGVGGKRADMLRLANSLWDISQESGLGLGVDRPTEYVGSTIEEHTRTAKIEEAEQAYNKAFREIEEKSKNPKVKDPELLNKFIERIEFAKQGVARLLGIPYGPSRLEDGEFTMSRPLTAEEADAFKTVKAGDNVGGRVLTQAEAAKYRNFKEGDMVEMPMSDNTGLIGEFAGYNDDVRKSAWEFAYHKLGEALGKFNRADGKIGKRRTQKNMELQEQILGEIKEIEKNDVLSPEQNAQLKELREKYEEAAYQINPWDLSPEGLTSWAQDRAKNFVKQNRAVEKRREEAGLGEVRAGDLLAGKLESNEDAVAVAGGMSPDKANPYKELREPDFKFSEAELHDMGTELGGMVGAVQNEGLPDVVRVAMAVKIAARAGEGGVRGYADAYRRLDPQVSRMLKELPLAEQEYARRMAVRLTPKELLEGDLQENLAKANENADVYTLPAEIQRDAARRRPEQAEEELAETTTDGEVVANHPLKNARQLVEDLLEKGAFQGEFESKAKKLLDLKVLDKVPVEVWTRLKNNALGDYKFKTGKVRISEQGLESMGETALHEIDHALLDFFLDPINKKLLTKKQLEAVDRLRKLHEKSRELAIKDGYFTKADLEYISQPGAVAKTKEHTLAYMFSDVQEWTAAVSSEKFMSDFLRTIRRDEVQTGFWKKLGAMVREAIASVFGRPSVYHRADRDIMDLKGAATEETITPIGVRMEKLHSNAVELAEKMEETYGVDSPEAQRAKETVQKLEAMREGRMRRGEEQPVGEEMDREYLAAVERGDMETAQRLVNEAAEKAGYGEKDWYHGTNSNYNEINRSSTGNYGPGIYFTSDRKFATGHAEAKANLEGGEARVITARLKEDKHVSFRPHGAKGEWAKAWDSNDVKMSDPVTYDDNGNVIPLSQRFNRENPDIRYRIAPAKDVQPDEPRMKRSEAKANDEIADPKEQMYYRQRSFDEANERADNWIRNEGGTFDKLFRRDNGLSPIDANAAAGIFLANARSFLKDYAANPKPTAADILTALRSKEVLVKAPQLQTALASEAGQTLAHAKNRNPGEVNVNDYVKVMLGGKTAQQLGEGKFNISTLQEGLARIKQKAANMAVDGLAPMLGENGISKPEDLAALKEVLSSATADRSDLHSLLAAILPGGNAAKVRALTEKLDRMFNLTATAIGKQELPKVVHDTYNGQPVVPHNEHFIKQFDKFLKLGKYNEDEVNQLLLESLGLSGYDANFIKGIRNGLEKAYQMPEGLPRNEMFLKLQKQVKSKFINSVLKEINESRGAGQSWSAITKNNEAIRDLMYSAWQAGLLSGPNTSLVNIVGSGMSVVLETLTEALARSYKNKDLRYFGDVFGGFMTALVGNKSTGRSGAAWLESASALHGHGTKYRNEVLDRIPLLENVDAEGLTGATKGVASYLNALKYVGRFLSASDAVNMTMADEAAQRMRVRDFLNSQPGISKEKKAEIMRDMFDPDVDVMKALKKTANEEADKYLEKGVGEGERNRWVNRRVQELLEKRRADVIPDVVEAGRNQGERFTYNYETKGVAGMFLKLISQANQNLKEMRYLTPFMTMAANLTNQFLDYTPYGIARAKNMSLGQKMFKEGHDLAPRAYEQGSPEQMAQIARGAIGTTFFLGLGYMAYMSIQQEQEGKEPYLKMTGPGPRDPLDRRQLEESDWKPNSIKINGRWIKYTDLPIIAPALGAIGSFMDAVRYKKGQQTNAEAVAAASVAVATTMLQKNMLSGVNNFLQLLQPGNAGEQTNAAKKLSSGIVSGFTNPAMARWIRNTFDTDKEGKVAQLDNTTTAGWLYSMVPFSMGYDTPALNTLGEPIKRSMLSTTTYRFADFDNAEPHPIISPLVGAGLMLPNPEKSSKFTAYNLEKGEAIESTMGKHPEIMRRYVQVRGELMKQVLVPDMVSQLAQAAEEDLKSAQDYLNHNIGRTVNRAAIKQIEQEIMEGKLEFTP